MLYAINYFLSRFASLTNESATEVISRLRTPVQLNYQRSRSAKLLNIQIKQEMYRLLRDVTHDVLEGLERELRTRAKGAWATTFSVILILSTCVEAVQVAADGYIVHKLLGKDHSVSRDEAIEICRQLDERPFASCMNLFHDIYRTSRSKNGQRNEKGFNPIRDGLELNGKEGFDRPTLELVDEIRSIIRNHGKHSKIT